MRRDWKETIAQLYGPFYETLTDCRAMSINTEIRELLILRRKRQTVKSSRRHCNGKYLFHAGIKSFSDSQGSEVFEDILFD